MGDVPAAFGLGLAVGLLSGLFGVGGSSVSTPSLRIFLDTPRLLALGSPLPMTFPAALAGSLAYQRWGLINGRAVVWVAASGVPAVVIGSFLTRWVPGHWLMFLTAVAVVAVGVQLVRSIRPMVGEDRLRSYSLPWQRASAVKLFAIATPIGFFSGLLANAGGFLLVPAFVLLFGASLREAAATSLPCVALLALPGTLVHGLLGHVDGWLTLGLSLGVVPSTLAGAQLSLRLRRVGLRRPFGLFLALFGLYFFVRELMETV